MKTNFTFTVLLLLAFLHSAFAQTRETLQAPKAVAGQMFVNTQKARALSLGAPVLLDPKTVAAHHPGRIGDSGKQATEQLQRTGKGLDHDRLPLHANSPENGSATLRGGDGNGTPQIDTGFQGNIINQFTPTDNSVAISDDGYVVSVANSSILFADTSGEIQLEENFSDFLAVLEMDGPFFDPKVLYDPEEEKFIFVVASGNTAPTSRIVIGFSTSNDPNAPWWFYTFSGDPIDQGFWFDSPFIGISKNELIISGNQHWANNSFAQILIYQLEKAPGFTGGFVSGLDWWGVLDADGFYADSVVPLSYGFDGAVGPGIYLVSTFPKGGSYGMLYYITGESQDSPSIYSYRFYTPKYYTPLSGAMKGSSGYLDDGDCRVLSGFYANGIAHFVYNSRGDDLHTKVNYCRLDIGNLTQKTISIGQQAYEYAFPAVAPFALTPTDKTVLIGFLRTGGSIYPQFCMGTVDNDLNFSGAFVVKEGESYVDAGTAPIESWGKYTGISRRHSTAKAEVWISGSYGMVPENDTSHVLGNWIAGITDGQTGTTPVVNLTSGVLSDFQVFPNPVADRLLNTRFASAEPAVLKCRIADLRGAVVSELGKHRVNAGLNEIKFNTGPLLPGAYYLLVQNAEDGAVLKMEKFVVAR